MKQKGVTELGVVQLLENVIPNDNVCIFAEVNAKAEAR